MNRWTPESGADILRSSIGKKFAKKILKNSQKKFRKRLRKD